MIPVSNIGTRVPLQIRRGADFSCLLTFKNPDGSALDLTGCALEAQIWLTGQNVASCVVTASSPSTLGTATMVLAAADSLAIPPTPDFFDDDSCAWWGLSFTDSTGKISTPLYGPVQIFPALT